jgi:UDP-N-acetylmuramoylalanine--D-glutamate ligase
MRELRGIKAVVLGLGVHGGGVGVARFLAEQGADVLVTDLRPAEQLADSLAALADLPIRFVLGEHRADDMAAAALVVRNPAVPDASPYIRIARAAGAAIEMEMTLFFRRCPAPIIGITGTKGKTTTTMLVGAMLQQHDADTIVAGNLRVSALAQLGRIGPTTPVVLELSSFVLEGLGAAGLSPRLALVTNMSPDHLDRYADFAAYVAAKLAIVTHQRPGDTAILNADDATAPHFAAAAGGAVGWFGMHAPGPDRGLAAWYADGWLVVRVDGRDEPVCPAAELRLAGAHNLANLAGAALLARVHGVPCSTIRAAVRQFRGVPHRQQLVAEIGGVRYINDTAATAPDAAIAALHSYTAPIVLIAGGSDKRLPLAPLARAIAERARHVVLLAGSATPHLQHELAATPGAPPISGPYDDIDQAVAAAAALARPGELVLLSPGCASFGMFRNEFHRGDAFSAGVTRLAEGADAR